MNYLKEGYMTGFSNMTEEEKIEHRKRRQEYNLSVGYRHYHKYEKTRKGFLMRKYRNMQSRVTGVQKAKYHLYRGLSILPREDFYNWAFLSPEFHKLYDEWVEAGYDRKLCPSVNRIDSSKGYQLDNMEWITHSENSRLGSLSQRRVTA